MKKEPLLIAFASQKGGVGKSAFTVLVASILHYQKGLKVGVVDCDSPQHSISRMRDRDIESVQESDFLKVVLYRQHEQIRKRSYPVIKSNPEKATSPGTVSYKKRSYTCWSHGYRIPNAITRS